MSVAHDSLRLFGTFQFICQGQPVTLGQVRLEELLAYLALHAGAPVARSEIAFRFWPDSSEKQALNNLRKILLLLRRALPNANAYLQVERQSLQWRVDAPCTVDVARFQAAIDTAARQTEPEIICERLIDAVECYAGDLLAGSYAEWIIPQRERLRQTYMAALDRLIDLLEARRAYDDAARYAERAVSHDPLHETGYLRLMRLHALQGDRARALRVYHACATVLRREMGVDPNEDLQAAYTQLLTDESTSTDDNSIANATPDAVASQLIGRQAEWQTLRACWVRLKRWPVQVVLISGEAGIGKTRLAEELLNWADRQGYATARARAYAIEGGLAYAPISEWQRSPRLRANLQQLSTPWLTEIARLLSELLEQFPDLPPPSPFTESWQRQRLYTAMAHGLLAGNQPLLLLLDDLQWADAETLTWLHYLLRFARQEGATTYPKARLLLICTLRDDEIDPTHTANQWLHQLRQESWLTEMLLQPLTGSEVAHLVEAMSGEQITPEQTALLRADTGGNPLFVVERVRSGADPADTTAVDVDLTGLQLPPKVLHVMQVRLGRLSAQAQELAGLAAIVGRAVRYEHLTAVSTRSEDEVVQALEELWQRRIFQETGSDGYDFSHDRLRDVVYAQLSRPRRRLLHRRVAEALQREQMSLATDLSGQIAGHFEHAGLADQAVDCYLAAGDQALNDWSAAQAEASFSRAYDLASDEAGQARALFGRARARFLQSQRPASLADVAEALALLDDPDHALRPQLLYLQADLHAADADPDAAEHAAQAALETAERVGDSTTVCQSLSLLGTMHSHRGDLDLELALIEQALTIARETDNRWREARTQADLAFLHAQMGEFGKAISFAQTALAYLEKTTDRGGVSFAWNILGRAYGGMGRFDPAFHAFEQCRQVAEEIDLKSMSLQIPNMLGWLHRQLGDYNGALELDLASVDAALRENVMTPAISARLNVCHDRLMMDDPEAALAELNVIEAQMANGDFGYHEWRWHIRLLHIQGLCYLHLGETARVLTLAEKGAALARHTSAKKYIALYYELAGAAMALQEHWPEAEKALEAAVHLADAIGCHPVGWRARGRLAKTMQQLGDEQRAHGRLSEAQVIIDTIAQELNDDRLRSIFLSSSEIATLM